MTFRRLRAPLLGAAVAGALLPATAHGAQPGVGLAGFPTVPQIQAAKDAGAQTVRVFVVWADIEQSPDAQDFSGFAGIAQEIAARGMKATFVVLGAPGWANGSSDTRVPPSDPATMADFLADFAAAPGIKGNVAGYEIWNEQDEDMFWVQPAGASRAQTYAALVNAVGPAVKAADPAAKVSLGALTGNNYDFLRQVYEAGLNRTAFDAVAVHTDTACSTRGPYDYYRENGVLARFTFLGYRTLRQVMLSFGDDKPIWMTELGWSTLTSTCERGAWAGQKPAGVTEAQQQQFLGQAFNCLSEDPYVTMAQWFHLFDGTQDVEELRHYGLLRADGSPKPAYGTFQQISGTPGHDVLAEPCGDFTAPTVALQAPAATRNGVAEYVGALLIRATATDSGLARVTFRIDGRAGEIRNFTGAALASGTPVELDWQGAKNEPLGVQQTLVVEAVDVQGNVGRSTIPIKRVLADQLAATLPTEIDLGKLSVNGPLIQLSGQVDGSPESAKAAAVGARASQAASLSGKVQAQFQWRTTKRIKRKGKVRRVPVWRTLHKQSANASKRFTFRQRVRKKGRWRVVVRYQAMPPYKSSTVTRSFRVRKLR